MKLFVIQDVLGRLSLVRPESEGWSGKVIATIEADAPKRTFRKCALAERDKCGSWKPKYDPIPQDAKNVMIRYEVEE